MDSQCWQFWFNQLKQHFVHCRPSKANACWLKKPHYIVDLSKCRSEIRFITTCQCVFFVLQRFVVGIDGVSHALPTHYGSIFHVFWSSNCRETSECETSASTWVTTAINVLSQSSFQSMNEEEPEIVLDPSSCICHETFLWRNSRSAPSGIFRLHIHFQTGASWAQTDDGTDQARAVEQRTLTTVAVERLILQWPKVLDERTLLTHVATDRGLCGSQQSIWQKLSLRKARALFKVTDCL